MQKIKYIIMFTLTLAVGILYVQLSDYQNITNVLLAENSNSNSITKSLQNTISNLKTENSQLTAQVISLQEELAVQKITSGNTNYILDTNTTHNFMQQQNTIDLPEKKPEELPIDMTPNITLDEENKITGFGLEYKQNF